MHAGQSFATSENWPALLSAVICELDRLQTEDSIYKQAIETMAAQFVHPKTTARELAEQILGEQKKPPTAAASSQEGQR
jgi:hypothetical protein